MSSNEPGSSSSDPSPNYDKIPIVLERTLSRMLMEGGVNEVDLAIGDEK